MNRIEATLAIDIGGTSMRAAAVSGSCLLARLEAPTLAQRGPADVQERLLELIRQLPVCSGPVGVACTGKVTKGIVNAINVQAMPGWRDIALQDFLARHLNKAVHVLNDAQAAALAEWHLSQAENFMFVTVSTGIGSGLVLGGELHQAGNGLGFVSGPSGQVLERVASGTALGELARQNGFADAASLFDAAEDAMQDRHALACELLYKPLQLLAERLQDIHTLLGLDTISLGGSVGLRSYMLQQLQQTLSTLKVQAAHYGADAGLVGAAYYAEQQQKR